MNHQRYEQRRKKAPLERLGLGKTCLQETAKLSAGFQHRVHWAENWDRDAQSLGSWHPPASGTPWHLPWDTGMDRETPQCPMTLQLKNSFKTFYLNKLKFKIQKQFQNLTSWGLIVAARAACQTGWHFASKGCNQLWPIGPHPPQGPNWLQYLFHCKAGWVENLQTSVPPPNKDLSSLLKWQRRGVSCETRWLMLLLLLLLPKY